MFLFAFFISLLSWFNTPACASPNEPVNLYISTDNGQSWEGFAKGLPSELNVMQVIEHKNSIYLTAIGDGVYVLEKDSDTWVKRNTGLPTADAFDGLPLGKKTRRDFFPTSIAAKGDRIVIGSYDDGAFYSDDDGQTWTQATTNVDDVVSALLFTDGLLIAGTHRGIWQSADGGVNWELRCETGFRINALALHNNQLHVARQNGMGILTENDIEWADLETDWAIGQLHSEGGSLYVTTAKKEVFRTTAGEVWESNKFAIKGLPANSLMEAMWNHLTPKIPGDLPAGRVTETSRGWVLTVGGGC